MPRSSIIVATDLSPRSHRAVDRAIRLGAVTGRRVKVVHALDSEAAAIDSGLITRLVRDTLSDRDADVDILLPTGSPPQAIAETAEAERAELILAGPARYNQIGDYILGTAIDYLVRQAKVPVLIVKQRPHEDYRRILVPTDFSDTSKTALLRAAKLFPDCTIDVLHAYHVAFEGWQKSDYVREETDKDARRELDRFLADTEVAEALGSRVTGHLGYGGVDSVVADAIESLTPDLVVLGTHGSSGFRHATLGSNATALLNWIAPDTLMVPPQS